MAVPHLLILPYPSQGHINPMLQFAKRLASKGAKVTLVTTRYTLRSVRDKAAGQIVAFAPISDGYDSGGLADASCLEEYLRSLHEIGSSTLAELVEARRSSAAPFTCMVYDTYTPWAREVAGRLDLPAIAFSTQSCSVSAVYFYAGRALLPQPVEDGASFVSVKGLPLLSRSEIPSFLLPGGAYPTLAAFALSQFSHLVKNDWVLFNSFDKLENEVLAGLNAYCRARAVGPTVPSAFVDGNIAGDDCYDIDLLETDGTCTHWLDGKAPASVVYVSFGSFATLSDEQTAELARGLRESGHDFLWVVRASEHHKLPAGFREEAGERGKVVGWAPQLAVLGHCAVGCFVTHCGWNSTLEALSLGVPVVAVPQWTDQPTNARLVEAAWGVGVRATCGGDISGEAISGAVKDVMHGERAHEIRCNAERWKEAAREALSEGGSSDRSINELLEFIKGLGTANSSE